MSHQIIGAIEIGTSHVKVLVGELGRSGGVNVIGLGLAPSEGLKKGEIVDFKAASTAVHEAITRAEESAGVNLEQVYLAQSGGHLRSFASVGSVSVSASDNCVNKVDVKRATDSAKSKELPSERVYIHHIQNHFSLDGRPCLNPLGMEGERLEVHYRCVHGDLRKVRDPIHVINGFGLHVEDIILSSIASGAVLAESSEKQGGVLVIDIGCGTTDYALYQDGCIAHVGVLSVAGDHLTNDLGLGLRISYEVAESLKCAEGTVLAVDPEDLIVVPGEHAGAPRTVRKAAVADILRLRLEELSTLVLQDLKKYYDFSKPLAGGIILTGGTSALPGASTVLESIFKQSVRIGELPNWVNPQLAKQEFSTVLGLLKYGVGQVEPVERKERQGSFVNKVKELLSI